MTKVKVDELRKALFENKQKLIRGEFKDTSFFKKTRREIARLLSGKAEAVVATAPKKAKVAKVEVVATTEAPAAAPKKTRKTKAKKEEQ